MAPTPEGLLGWCTFEAAAGVSYLRVYKVLRAASTNVEGVALCAAGEVIGPEGWVANFSKIILFKHTNVDLGELLLINCIFSTVLPIEQTIGDLWSLQ